jgi:multidrug efflux pump subunit AcrB
MMIFTPTSIHFNIEINKNDLLAILERDKTEERNRNWNDTLFNKLDRIDGVIDVNYDGHFGPNIHLRMDLNRSMRDTAEDVKKTIKEYINGKQ